MKYDIIGDVHGCWEELQELLAELGYDEKGRHLYHPEKRIAVFPGDLTDRGPDSVKVMEKVCDWVNNGDALYCPGNHCNKLYRYLLGNPVKVTHGLETTVAELESLSDQHFEKVKQKFINLYNTSPLYLELGNCALIAAHAGIRADMIGREDKKVKTFVLYGDITGETYDDGRPVRRDWAAAYRGKPFIVYGHTPVRVPREIGKTVNIDTGCVFGGKLTAFSWPEKTFTSVPSRQPFTEEKFSSFN